MAKKEVIELDEKNFDKVVGENTYAVVDFWAPWCGPCRMMAPTVDKVAEELTNVQFCKCNVDEHNELANRYRVAGIPCFLFFKDGKAITKKVGGDSQENFANWVKENTK